MRRIVSPDVELASRLSFFLWSSIPDDELLDLAIQRQAARREGARPAGAAHAAPIRVRAPRWWRISSASGCRFATCGCSRQMPTESSRGSTTTCARRSCSETELFLESQLQEDRSVLDLLTADYTFLNEQLARHYGIPDVYGSHFRRVTLADENRWGLLGKASILSVTSYPHRTSPTIRGKWLLENILGAPVAAAASHVNTNSGRDEGGRRRRSVREMLEQHRANPGCASCHARMDPLGFSLENFDALGQWRTKDGDAAIDASGVLLDGTKVDGPAALRAALLAAERSVRQGGHREAADVRRRAGDGIRTMPRRFARSCALPPPTTTAGRRSILAIVKSPPFQIRRSEIMIVTKKAISRRTVLRGVGRDHCACRCSTRWCRR